MGWKKIIIGEKMPDKDDPAYKEKREQAENAGKTFAKALRLDKVAAFIQGFATKHSKVFLGIVFSFVLLSISLNLYRMINAVQKQYSPASAIERQEKELHFERHHTQVKISSKINEDKQMIINKKTIQAYEVDRKD